VEQGFDLNAWVVHGARMLPVATRVAQLAQLDAVAAANLAAAKASAAAVVASNAAAPTAASAVQAARPAGKSSVAGSRAGQQGSGDRCASGGAGSASVPAGDPVAVAAAAMAAALGADATDDPLPLEIAQQLEEAGGWPSIRARIVSWLNGAETGSAHHIHAGSVTAAAHVLVRVMHLGQT
jgi:hypothetical protein